MKEKIKSILADIVYWMYQKEILKNRIRVKSMDQTIDELLSSGKSIVRFGDSDIVMMCGRETIVQEKAPELGARMADILSCKQENLLVGIPDIFEGLDQYSKRSRRFWKNHLLIFRKVYEKYCVPDYEYCNAFLSRMYYNFLDKSMCGTWMGKFRKLWDGHDLIIVEGAGTHNGVGNDLLDNAGKIERIICPPTNAFAVYDQIKRECLKADKGKLFLVSLGSTAKILVSDLVKEGYRVIDIGNLDMEYEWFLDGADKKEKLKKHEIIEMEANREAGYYEYLSQIKAWIEGGIQYVAENQK